MNCPVCDGQTFKQWGVVGAYEIIACCTCGLGMTNPFPTQEELESTNSQIYQVQQRIKTYLYFKNYYERRYLKYIDNIKMTKKNGTLLDVGCNIGLFLKVARDEGFQVTGIELNQGCADYGRRCFGLDIHSDYLEKNCFSAGSFDVVTLFDVLEHVPDLHGFLREIKRVLKPGGLLVVQSPNLESLMAELTGSRWSWLTPPDHLYHFTSGSLAKLLYDSGFTVKDSRTWEPAREFSVNILSANKSKSIIVKLLFGLNRVTHLVTFFVLIVQRLWWHKLRGGLLEVYAAKSDGV